MSDKISRRDFLKLAGAGGALATVLTGCGPASRYVTREPYYAMPEYTTNGQSTYYATMCRECAAGCGLVVRTMQGRALKIEGNKKHPVNLGKTCVRGQATLEGLYNPDRIQAPVKQARGSAQFEELTWDTAITTVTEALKNDSSQVAFLMGLAPDHLFDLVSLTGLNPIRYGALSMFEARATLTEASRRMFGKPSLLFFDLAGSDVTFSFGANFLETWVSPVAYTRGYSKMRQGVRGRRGYLVQFEPRMSQTAMVADEWIPVKPGTEGMVALAIGRLAAEIRGTALPQALLNVNVDEIVTATGLEKETLERLGRIFAGAEHPLAIPGGSALGHTNGLEAAQAILALNAMVGNLGQAGGVYLTPGAGVDEYHRPASMQEMGALIDRMNKGEIKVLFVHGVNPIFELPSSMGFAAALKNVPTVISFSSFPDETALQSDYIFPDHTPLESWGYQRAWVGADRAVLSGAQPAVAPLYNTRATADILLAAVQAVGGNLAAALTFTDEVAFIEDQANSLLTAGGFFSAPETKTFMAQFQQYGGWWKSEAGLESPTTSILDSTIEVKKPEFSGDGEFYLHTYPSPIFGDGAGANRPWLQETPDPATTVMWNSWVEMNPKTAEELGIEDDDVVLISTPFGAIEASVYKYPAIRPDTIAIPFGQGHTALGRYATIEEKSGFDLNNIWPGNNFDPSGENLLGNRPRGANPAVLFGPKFNVTGDLAFGSFKVKVEKTGRQRRIARMESRIGVYGDGFPKE